METPRNVPQKGAEGLLAGLLRFLCAACCGGYRAVCFWGGDEMCATTCDVCDYDVAAFCWECLEECCITAMIALVGAAGVFFLFFFHRGAGSSA